MKLDTTMIKNESILKLTKSLSKVKDKFEEMLSIALDTATYEIDQEKRVEVEHVLSDLFNDQFNKFVLEYTKCMNKASSLIETSLGT